MLKGIAFFLSIVLFVFCFYALYAERSPVFRGYATEYELYLKAGSFGEGTVYATDKDYYEYLNVKGESCFVNASYEQLLRDFNATHIFIETTAAGESRYAYSPRIRYKIYIGGRAVNIHYFTCESYAKVGTPIIYGGF
ncbi:MAG: hypothetical protein J5911_03890 [Clostridia bacterium]|nr:hypothetical protein [Clostridia bacterium]